MTATTTELLLDDEAQKLLFLDARTANNFTDEPVTDDQLKAIYDLVKYGPTSMNIQPMRLTVVRTPEAKQRLVQHMSEGNKAKTAAAPVSVIFASNVDFHEHLPRTYPSAVGVRERLAESAEARETMAGFNAALQFGYFIVGIRAAGLAAGPMTGFDAAGMTAEFYPDGTHRAQLVVNVGKPGPDAWFDRNPRLDYHEIATTL